jgi:hypothetical protein
MDVLALKEDGETDAAAYGSNAPVADKLTLCGFWQAARPNSSTVKHAIRTGIPPIARAFLAAMRGYG